MEWSNETVLQFLAQYKAHSCIWDPRDPFYNKRNHVNDAWSDIKDSMGIPCTVKELKKKRESLMSAYRGYKCKIKNLEKLGAVYRPTWFAYQFMDGFLRSIYQYSGIRNNQNKQRLQQIKIEVSSDNDEPDETSHNECLSTREMSTSVLPQMKQENSAEIQEMKNQMDQTMNIFKAVFQHRNDEEDECGIFGKLVAIKLRKLPEDRKDIMMFKINELLYGENQTYTRPGSSFSSGSSHIMPNSSNV